MSAVFHVFQSAYLLVKSRETEIMCPWARSRKRPRTTMWVAWFQVPRN